MRGERGVTKAMGGVRTLIRLLPRSLGKGLSVLDVRHRLLGFGGDERGVSGGRGEEERDEDARISDRG